MTCQLIITILIPGKGPVLFRFQQSLIQLILSLEVVDLLLLKLDPNPVHLFLCPTQLLLLNRVELVQLILEVVQVPVLVYVNLLQPWQLLLQALVLLHEGWLHCYQVLVTLLGTLELRALLLQLLLQVTLLGLHVWDVFHHLRSALLLLFHYSLYGVLDVGLIVRLVSVIHTL